MSRVVVVTGPSGRGKTEFSSHLARQTGYRHINVGDALQRKVGDRLGWLPQRVDVGPLFFTLFTMDDYLGVLDNIAQPGVIIDGIRLFEGIMNTRGRYPDMVHIHLSYDVSTIRHSQQNFDWYSNFVPEMEYIADRVIRWYVPVEEMGPMVENELSHLQLGV